MPGKPLVRANVRIRHLAGETARIGANAVEKGRGQPRARADAQGAEVLGKNGAGGPVLRANIHIRGLHRMFRNQRVVIHHNAEWHGRKRGVVVRLGIHQREPLKKGRKVSLHAMSGIRR